MNFEDGPMMQQGGPMVQQGGPMVHQGGPVVQNTTVVVQQPQQVVLSPRTWATGVCGCFDDCSICLCGMFLPCCLGCNVATAMNENCCVPNCLHGGTVAMRTKLRMQYNIVGTICDDWCITTYCGVCAMCQMARELKANGAY